MRYRLWATPTAAPSLGKDDQSQIGFSSFKAKCIPKRRIVGAALPALIRTIKPTIPAPPIPLAGTSTQGQGIRQRFLDEIPPEKWSVEEELTVDIKECAAL